MTAALLFAGCGSGNETGTGGGGAGGATGGGGSGTGAGGTGTGGEPGCPVDVEPTAETVITSRGAVTGTTAGATRIWKGIPFAAPPVGDLRWKRPEEAACWSGALETKEFGSKCVQVVDGAVEGDEDCLHLNVWMPDDAKDAPVPVLFFIHGGGNTNGGTSTQQGGIDLHDGGPLSEAGHVAVVTANYRLGPFGWLSHPSFAEGEPAASGNYGAWDQIAALRWVQENIAAFGGDPARVMIFGESAGGQNVCTLVASPEAKGLFSAAIMESGGCTGTPQAAAEAVAADWAALAGCDADPDPAACMRALSAKDAVELMPAPVEVAGKQGPFQPHIDGVVMPKSTGDAIEAGEHNHVPFAIGTNENETGNAVADMTEAEYEALVTATFSVLADQVLAEYPVADFATPRDAYVAVTSDAKFICPARKVARAMREHQTEPVYRYQFTHVLDNVGPAAKKAGAFHGLELFFVFGHLDVANYVPSAGEKALSQAMMGYWSRLGGAGDPNTAGEVEWPVYDVATDSYIEFDNTISAKAGVHTDHCDFWDSLAPG